MIQKNNEAETSLIDAPEKELMMSWLQKNSRGVDYFVQEAKLDSDIETLLEIITVDVIMEIYCARENAFNVKFFTESLAGNLGLPFLAAAKLFGVLQKLRKQAIAERDASNHITPPGGLVEAAKTLFNSNGSALESSEELDEEMIVEEISDYITEDVFI